LGVVLTVTSVSAFLLRPLRSSLDLPNGDNGGALACFPARSPGERKGFGTGSLGLDGVPGADPLGDAVPARAALDFDGVDRDKAIICLHCDKVDWKITRVVADRFRAYSTLTSSVPYLPNKHEYRSALERPFFTISLDCIEI